MYVQVTHLPQVRPVYRHPKGTLNTIKTDTVLAEVCKRFAVTIEQIKGGCRKQHLVNARKVACYVLYCMRNKHNAIAAAVGYTDHTTSVFHVQEMKRIVSATKSTGFEDLKEIALSILETITSKQPI